jgi:cytidyltransferase-like protein
MIKVLVSGCYDVIHGGHIECFTQAKALGDYLVISIASDNVLLKYKSRKSSIPVEHKKKIIESLNMVDEVVISDSTAMEGIDFIDHWTVIQPNILVATEDDKFKDDKKICGCHLAEIQSNLVIGYIWYSDSLIPISRIEAFMETI